MVHDNVEKIRKARGITKTHIANKLGMSCQGYRHLMSGAVRLDVERLKIIAGVLGTEPAIFFDDKLTDAVIEKINVSLENLLYPEVQPNGTDDARKTGTD